MGQDKPGGLRDKPGKKADVYHTFYALCGLSSAQHRVYRSKSTADKLNSQWKDSPAFRPSTIKEKPESEEIVQARRREIWVQSRSWREDETSHRYVGSPSNRVVRIRFLRMNLISSHNPTERDASNIHTPHQSMRRHPGSLLWADDISIKNLKGVVHRNCNYLSYHTSDTP